MEINHSGYYLSVWIDFFHNAFYTPLLYLIIIGALSARKEFLDILPSDRATSLSNSNSEQYVSMDFSIDSPDVLRCSDNNSQVVTQYANFSLRAILTHSVENLKEAFISIHTLYI